MREIKFRGRKSNGEWMYGDLVTTETTDGQPSKVEIREWNRDLECPEEVIPDTIGQFTGVLDKNGNEIYEGDIVQQYWGFPHYRKGVRYECYSRIGKVLFDKSGCFVLLSESFLYYLFGNDLTPEVIGNIHDNAELLNK